MQPKPRRLDRNSCRAPGARRLGVATATPRPFARLAVALTATAAGMAALVIPPSRGAGSHPLVPAALGLLTALAAIECGRAGAAARIGERRPLRRL
jgi:hypothetical protein